MACESDNDNNKCCKSNRNNCKKIIYFILGVLLILIIFYLFTYENNMIVNKKLVQLPACNSNLTELNCAFSPNIPNENIFNYFR